MTGSFASEIDYPKVSWTRWWLDPGAQSNHLDGARTAMMWNISPTRSEMMKSTMRERRSSQMFATTKWTMNGNEMMFGGKINVIGEVRGCVSRDRFGLGVRIYATNNR